MTDYNRTILAGRLVRDPETKTTTKGSVVTRVTLAVNRRYRHEGETKEETAFVDVDFWGRQAEIVAEHMHKGREMLVEGSLAMAQWEDRETGKKRSKLYVRGSSLEFIGPKGEGSSGQRPAPSSSGSEGAEVPF